MPESRLNEDHPTRPIIKVIYNEKGEAFKETLMIDLMKDLTLFIDKKIEL